MAGWELVMPYSVKANKVTTLEFDMQDLRSLLSEKSYAILGDVEEGFARKIEMEPLFVVEHGEATLAGVRVVVTDTLGAQTDRVRPIAAVSANRP